MNQASNKGLISIIIPVYNSEKYLSRCIESVISQEYVNTETILINDGSTDKSKYICNEYALKDRRIKVIHTPNNGQSSARNEGIRNSNGEFIFFLDSDDYIGNNSLSSFIKEYEKDRSDLIVGNFKKINEKNISFDSGHEHFFLDNQLLTKKDIFDYVRKYLKKPNRFPLFVYSWGRLFKSSVLKKNNIFFNDNLQTFEDVAFNFDYLTHIDKLSFLTNPLYNHQTYEGYSSATMSIRNNPKKLFGYKYALKSITNFLEKSNSGIDIKREIGHTDVCYTIIQLVRTCGQINRDNKKQVSNYIDDLINEKEFRNNLKYYSPSKGDSKIVPVLMKLKLPKLVEYICRYKAYKRYKPRLTTK